MGYAILTTRNVLTGSRITVEEGSFHRTDGGTGDQRLLCETHGNDFAYVTVSSSMFYVTKKERLRLIRRPWEWCGGCAVAYGEIGELPENWIYVSLHPEDEGA